MHVDFQFIENWVLSHFVSLQVSQSLYRSWDLIILFVGTDPSGNLFKHTQLHSNISQKNCCALNQNNFHPKLIWLKIVTNDKEFQKYNFFYPQTKYVKSSISMYYFIGWLLWFTKINNCCPLVTYCISSQKGNLKNIKPKHI